VGSGNSSKCCWVCRTLQRRGKSDTPSSRMEMLDWSREREERRDDTAGPSDAILIKLEEVNYDIDAILCCNSGCLCNRTLEKEDPTYSHTINTRVALKCFHTELQCARCVNRQLCRWRSRILTGSESELQLRAPNSTPALINSLRPGPTAPLPQNAFITS
jgi:hypothetical protein